MGDLLNQAKVSVVEMPDGETGAKRFDLRCRPIDLDTMAVRW